MYRLWVRLLVTERVAIVAADGSPEYWLPIWGQPCKPEGALACKECAAMMKNRVRRFVGLIPVPVKFLTSKTSLKYLLGFIV